MNSKTLREVIALVAQQTGATAERITADTRLSEDLRVDGDDASDLLGIRDAI